MKPTKNRFFCILANRAKMLFKTEQEADNFIKFNSQDIDTHGKKLRVYYCQTCGGYHLTKTERSGKFINMDKEINEHIDNLKIDQKNRNYDKESADRFFNSLRRKFYNKVQAKQYVIEEFNKGNINEEKKNYVLDRIKEADYFDFVYIDKDDYNEARHLYKFLPNIKKEGPMRQYINEKLITKNEKTKAILIEMALKYGKVISKKQEKQIKKSNKKLGD